jgi:hypothetical protein
MSPAGIYVPREVEQEREQVEIKRKQEDKEQKALREKQRQEEESAKAKQYINRIVQVFRVGDSTYPQFEGLLEHTDDKFFSVVNEKGGKELFSWKNYMFKGV